LYGIEVRESGAGLLVEFWGEFDVFCIGEMKRILDEASSRLRPVLVDLSEITFLDLCSAREIAVRSMLRTHRPTFLDPSPQVTATMTALGLEGWPDALPGVGCGGPRVFPASPERIHEPVGARAWYELFG
jgi:anti-anti-sigma regulatory factor